MLRRTNTCANPCTGRRRNSSTPAERARPSIGRQRPRRPIDIEFRLALARPLLFTGEAAFPWMFEECPELKPFAAAMDELMRDTEFDAVYDPARLVANETLFTLRSTSMTCTWTQACSLTHFHALATPTLGLPMSSSTTGYARAPAFFSTYEARQMGSPSTLTATYFDRDQPALSENDHLVAMDGGFAGERGQKMVASDFVLTTAARQLDRRTRPHDRERLRSRRDLGYRERHP